MIHIKTTKTLSESIKELCSVVNSNNVLDLKVNLSSLMFFFDRIILHKSISYMKADLKIYFLYVSQSLAQHCYYYITLFVCHNEIDICTRFVVSPKAIN